MSLRNSSRLLPDRHAVPARVPPLHDPPCCSKRTHARAGASGPHLVPSRNAPTIRGMGRDYGHGDSGLRIESVRRWSNLVLLLPSDEITPNKLSTPLSDRVFPSSRRTRCREGTTVPEDAARSAPARPPAPPVSSSAACRTAPCRPTRYRHPDERSPAPQGPRSPYPRLPMRRGKHACRQRPTRHATPWPARAVPPGRNTIRRLRFLPSLHAVHASVEGRDTLLGGTPVPWHNTCNGRP